MRFFSKGVEEIYSAYIFKDFTVLYLMFVGTDVAYSSLLIQCYLVSSFR